MYCGGLGCLGTGFWLGRLVDTVAKSSYQYRYRAPLVGANVCSGGIIVGMVDPRPRLGRVGYSSGCS